MKDQNAIEIRGLVKHFPNFSLGPIDITVPRGAIYGFIGANGAGKTTTIDLIFGLGERRSGSIWVLGHDNMADEVAMKQKVGYVSPELNFIAWSKVGKAIQFFKSYYPSWDDPYCESLLNRFKLGWDDKIQTLSFGSRIKLSLLIAPSRHPELLILDEPTVGLDAITKQIVFGELLSAVKSGERTVFVSSHGLNEIERFADHIGMIKEGKMKLEGSTSEIVERFQMVDFTSTKPIQLSRKNGLYPQASGDHRYRAMIDRESGALEWLNKQNVQLISTTPVTLEELFIAIEKGN